MRRRILPALYNTNTFSRIAIVVAYWYNLLLQEDMSLLRSYRRGNKCKCIVFVLCWPGLEPRIYSVRGKRAEHYTTDMVIPTIDKILKIWTLDGYLDWIVIKSQTPWSCWTQMSFILLLSLSTYVEHSYLSCITRVSIFQFCKGLLSGSRLISFLIYSKWKSLK
jgi:hypothetical protein